MVPVSTLPLPSSDETGLSSLGNTSPLGGDGDEGGPPPDKPPIIIGGAGANQGVTVDGVGALSHDIPIGAIAMFKVDPPNDPGYIIDTTKITWANGTDYKSYFSDPAEATPPTWMGLSTNVPKNEVNYRFIVGPEPRGYSISVSVEYTNGAHGTSTMTFNSARPTASIEVVQAGQVIFGTDPATPAFYSGGMFGLPNNFVLRAHTGPDAQDMVGSFMFLQTINYHQSATDPNMRVITRTLGGVTLHDDGFDLPAPKPIGYESTMGEEIAFIYGWKSESQPMGQEVVVTMRDGPTMNVEQAYATFSFEATFQTYLMYQADIAGGPNGPTMAGAVWIAVEQVNWHMKAEATNIGGPQDPNWVPLPPVNPNPQRSTPLGASAFPGWFERSNSSTWV